MGANLRAAPSTTAARVGFLAQYVLGQADQSATDSSGATWYKITAPEGTGWVRGDLLVDDPVAYYSGATFQMPGWSALISPPYIGQSGTIGKELVLYGPVLPSWWMLTVRTAPSGASFPPPLGFAVIADHPELYERSEPVNVWTYTVTKREVRASLDICRLPHMKPFGGWSYNTSVQVVTPTRAYQFIFETLDPDSPIVRRALDSINISQ
jgi:hypothetical protein